MRLLKSTRVDSADLVRALAPDALVLVGVDQLGIVHEALVRAGLVDARAALAAGSGDAEPASACDASNEVSEQYLSAPSLAWR
ncbi:hypothetical protein [Sorangium sp. So ce1099]|uniref:hypothetical protein n=1 Tax=Sorangium sp. So ce1099 TaxID=3133331 RepID=UPI003F61B7E2